MERDAVLRMIDANFNRAMEGLRVCEDVNRFIYNEDVLTRRLKSLRHDLRECVLAAVNLNDLHQNRDIVEDVGRSTTDQETQRDQVAHLFLANIQRVKESMRVLEEVCKLIDQHASQMIKNLRYEVYDIEKTFSQTS
jgi:thiamine-phosphate pyrophosphorylase